MYTPSPEKLKEEYYALVDKVKSQGISEPKRHGEYFRLKVYDDYVLLLDTWNKSISVLKGGKYKYSLGIDFGGFRSNIPMVRFWNAHIPQIRLRP